MISFQDVRLKLTKDLIIALIQNNAGQIVSFEPNQEGETYWEQIEVDFNVIELPQYPVVPVKSVERIKIWVAEQELPIVFCRDDFPIVPHLNVSATGEKALCLFDVPFQDIRYMFNASMFVNRISFWFTKTSRGELHQLNQPIEPFFLSVSDIIILDSSKLAIPFVRLDETHSSAGSIWTEKPLLDSKQGALYAKLQVNISKTFNDNIIRKQPQNLLDLDTAFEDDILKSIETCIQHIWSIKQNEGLYKALFNQSENELKKCKLLIVVVISLAREQGVEAERIEVKAFALDLNFKDLFRAFGYIIERNKMVKRDLPSDLRQVKLKQFEVNCHLTRDIAQSLNNLDSAGSNYSFFQIGVGSLGSQIANNCIRAGYGNWIFIDPDVLLPHNLVRHCLTSEYIGLKKPESIKLYSQKIFNEENPCIVQEIIQSSIFDLNQKEEIIAAIRKSHMAIDTSASVAVERYLCHELAGDTRCASFFMNPSGTSAIMLLEDDKRTISLDLLEMQYYRLLINEAEYKFHLQNEERIVYSTSCRGKSAIIPQDNIAIFSALCSKAIKHTADEPKAGICIWTINGLSISDNFVRADNYMHYDINGWKVKIIVPVIEKLFELRKQKLTCETGGVLVGTYDFERKICYIVDILPSPDDSIESPNSYIRGSKGLLQRINEIEKITSGNLGYIGEWHSHPNNITMQSREDIVLMKTITEYNAQHCCPGCMIIVGDDHISLYLKEINYEIPLEF